MSYKRSQERKHRLKKLYDQTKNSYGAGAWYNEEKNRYIRYSCHSSWLKHYCRKITRRRIKWDNDLTGKNNSYKKKFDYWWTLL